MDRAFEEILVDELKVPRTAVRPDSSLEDAGLDSIAVVELSMLISDRFGITVSDEELRDAGRIGRIERLIEQRRAQREGR